MSRTKGLAYEREIAIALRPLFPNAKRQLEYQEGLGVDLTDTGRLRIQCKRGKKYAPLSKIQEAAGDGIPALVTKGDRTETLIALSLEDFIQCLLNPRSLFEKVSVNVASAEPQPSRDLDQTFRKSSRSGC